MFLTLIGDGRNTFAWDDKWLRCGPLSSIISYRIYHAVGFTKTTSVRELVTRCGGDWPEEWIQAAPILNSYSIPMINQSRDVITWLVGHQEMTEFTVQSACKSLEESAPLVPWTNDVWFKGCVPKHSFCLWLTCHGRLPTQDRIMGWKHDPPDMLCVFCKLVPDSHAHLFFQCSFSCTVWRKVKHQVAFYGFPEEWYEIHDRLSQKRGPKKMEHKLALAATVYHIWRERNMRIFRDVTKPLLKVVEDICSVILNRMAWKTITGDRVHNG